MKIPKITIDPSALRHGIWGNTWKQWGYILLAFLGLYALLAGYLTGMLFAAKGVRQDNYRTMSGKHFGDFSRQLFTAPIFNMPAVRPGAPKDPNYFNRPDGCTAQTVGEALPGFPDEPLFQKPNGILACSNDDQWRWTVYPWVQDTNGLGQFPGCSNDQGAKSTHSTYIASTTSPAAADAAASSEEARTAWVCQNNLAY